ncbi:MAG: hypothetical protein SFV18_16765 [Bryobacteraceae bacterium]|nr:hypothetical protein [Bryobacteraceae bacterium]
MTENTEMLSDADGGLPLEDFIELRQHCLALREILLPDEIWTKYLDYHRVPDHVASHRSATLLAYRRGYLPKVTGPIHRYLLTETGISPKASNQYVNDLCEKWMLNAYPTERNRLSRIFRGRLVELQYAKWLEDQNHSVPGMEATGSGSDIRTRSPEGVETSYEVKFIGMEDSDFGALVETMESGPSVDAICPYQAVNYLIFRVYEASRQLASASGERVVVITIDSTAWFRFRHICHGWIDWRNPTFFENTSEQWKTFINSKGNPSKEDLRHAICRISRVKVYQQGEAFEFILELDAAIG